MADGSNPVARVDGRADTREDVIEPVANTVPAAPPPAPKRSLTRPILFALLPVVLVVGGYYYVTGGQVMETDNAYIRVASVGVSTDVAGPVVEIAVKDNQVVKKGQVLYRIRPDTYRIALDGAEAKLGAVRNEVLALKAAYAQALAQIAQAKADIPFYEAQFRRQQELQSSSAASKVNFDEARHDLDAARQKVLVAQASAQATLAQLGGNADQPIEQNPTYKQAAAAVDNARRDLDDTVVKASFDGIVTNVDKLQLGTYLQASQQAFNLVSSTDIWVDTNPKETELTYVRPGQSAEITVDTYPGLTWHGKVETISPAASSSFSLLPAQNTSGNWVKVVQRIPMRVSIDPSEGKPQLRDGMSVEVGVDTGHARGLPDIITDLFGGSGNRG